MPLFTQRKPAQTVSRSIAAALSSSAEPSPLEALQVDNLAAQTAFRGAEAQHQGALTQKLMAEVQAAEQAARDRNDPQKRLEHIATVAGATVPDVDRTQLYIRSGGERPLGITDQIERAIRAAAGALTSTDLATGKTNAEQMSHAQGSILSNIVRNASVGLPADQQNANVGPFRATAREPFSGGVNAQGVMANQETGAASVAVPQLLDAAVRAQQALGSSREASATAAEARAAASEARAAARGTGGGRGGQGKAPMGYQWTQDPNGDAVLEPIPGGPHDPKTKAAAGRPLPNPAVKTLSEAGASVEDTRRLTETFKDKYGGRTLLGGMSNTVQRLAGDATPNAIAEPGQAQWWQDMDVLQNQTRHALFGSALTKTELAAWEKTSITPRMDPKEIRANLTRRQDIEARAASKLARAYEAQGYNQQAIRELLGTGAEYLDTAAPPVADQRNTPTTDRRQEPRAAGSKRIVVDY